MKPNQLITSMLAVTALFVASCSTPRVAQNNAVQDDVYNTTAKAKEYIAPVIIQNTSQEYTDDIYYSKSEPDYDMDYSSRIDRFYYGNPNRSYYDPYYNYYGYSSFGFDPYGYNSFYRPYGYGMGLGLGGYFSGFYNNWNNPYLNWGYHGSMYYDNFWGPYSFYNRFGWGGGWNNGWNGGGWGGGVIVRNNENYRPRPNRSSEGMVRPGGRYNGTIPSRGNVNTGIGRPTRAENYNPSTSNNRPGRNSNSSGSSRPTRTTESRPAPSRETYSPPARSSSPPASSSGSGSSSSGGGSRPTRGGGRG